MTDVAMLVSALSGLKTAGEMIAGLSSAKNQAETAMKVLELTTIIHSSREDILTAREALASILEENRKLKDDTVRLEQFHSDMERYQLAEAYPGSVMYSLKRSMSNGEPAHYVCANCYQTRKKSLLNCIPKSDGWYAFACPNCKSTIPNGYRSASAAEYAPDTP